MTVQACKFLIYEVYKMQNSESSIQVNMKKERQAENKDSYLQFGKSLLPNLFPFGKLIVVGSILAYPPRHYKRVEC